MEKRAEARGQNSNLKRAAKAVGVQRLKASN